MFEYFNTMKTYAYDVCSTLGRMASSMLNKGVELKIGPTACTDGEKVIYLPNAMKRHLAWDEIDFVRYLVHHEYAHIQHSDDKEKVLDQGCAGCSDPLYAHILNCLEDVRIEALASREMMLANVFDRGREISHRMLAKQRAEDTESWTVENCLCYLLIQCTHDPDLCDERVVVSHKQPDLEMMWWLFRVSGVFLSVEVIDCDPDKYPSTFDLIPLADRIYRLLNKSASSGTASGLERRAKEEQGTGNDGFPVGGEDGGSMDPNELIENRTPRMDNPVDDAACSRKSDINHWGGGVAEQAASSLDAQQIEGEGGKAEWEESISEADIKGKSKGLSFGNFSDHRRDRKPDKEDAAKNYRWGLWAAGMAQQVVDKLRGMSRASYSPPKDSGIRVAQKAVPSFLRGLTTNVLRRRHRDRVRGTAVAMLVDDSGSMGYEECVNAWRAASMLCIACERAKIPSLIIRYSNGFRVEKMFSQPTIRVAHNLSSCWGGGTEAYKAIEQGMMHLGLRSESRRVLFFLTDGCTEDCRKLVQQCQNEGIEFVPILFGWSAVHAARRGGMWDMPSTITLPDTNIALGPILVERLAATL